jgi:adenosylcobinamide-phosphate synthase
VTRTQLALACALDLAVGDPPGWPHPVRAFGAVIARVDRARDRGASARRALAEGALLTGALVLAAALVGRFAERRAPVVGVVLGASSLAYRSLDDAVATVQDALVRDDLPGARRALAAIVGRDVDRLDAREVTAAALESLAESFCDGVVAPLFWLRAGGVGGALAFKAISTLDSMIGHREPPYTFFGRVAARTDDLANALPSRIAALALAALARDMPACGRAVATAWRDAPAHPSPNAGWPEAALAGALAVRLGGPASYEGVRTERPVLGAAFAAPQVADLARGRTLVRRAAALVGVLVVASAR